MYIYADLEEERARGQRGPDPNGNHENVVKISKIRLAPTPRKQNYPSRFLGKHFESACDIRRLAGID